MSLIASITIATWKRCSLLEKIILALEDQTIERDKYEIIICDSGSDDGTKQMVEEKTKLFPNIRYYETVNILAAKRNEGIRRSLAPIVIFMDDDVLPEKSFIEAHIASHEGRHKVVFCGLIRFPSEWVSKSNYFRFRDSRHLGSSRPDIDNTNIPFMNLVVMSLSFKKEEIINIVGFVSEEFIGYGCEDHEFAYRIWKAGFKIELNEDALAYHYEAGGTIDGYIKKMYHTARDGTPTLNRLLPEAIKYTKAQYLEPIESHDALKLKFIKRVLRIAINQVMAKLIQLFLNYTDHIPMLYSPMLFRYLFAYACISGCNARSENRTVSIEKGWYS